MRRLRWLKPDISKRPQEPTPSPVLYDWQQDADVITDFKLWGIFEVKIGHSAVLVSPDAVKPEQPTVIVPRPTTTVMPPQFTQPPRAYDDEGACRPDLGKGYRSYTEQLKLYERHLARRRGAEPVEYGDAVKPWGPGEHVTGSRGGWEGSE